MTYISGGLFRMGSDTHYPEEAPAHLVSVDAFWIDTAPVTNARFLSFVKATGHVTVAETAPDARDYPGAKPEMLHPASLVFRGTRGPVSLRDWSKWWELRRGADWRHPHGPGSSLDGLDDHPVVHVALADALAYAQWAGKDLLTEAEWEFAAWGGRSDAEYAWGDELTPGGRHMANTWQGAFPYKNSAEDGWHGTSPVGAFPANGYGLFDMIGNVWEWTRDWYSPRHEPDAAKACCIPHNPRGAAEAGSHDLSLPGIRIPRRVLKGGSFLCAPSYCRRYRPAARHAQPVDTSTCHIGFRCALRPKVTSGELPP
ncbi:formylglycine-generating enzyme family protein [Roseococcus sp. SYP-B2431]|nr:formylglycine-generating enzyme family protein [Roseococcus sp. SYP-B2431]